VSLLKVTDLKKTGRPIPQAEPKVNPESHHNNAAEIEPLDPEEEQRVIAEAEEYKNEGNEIFKTAKSEDEFKRAIQLYERCLSICPEYLKHYRTNYWGNISACYSRLEKYKETVDACKKSLDLDASKFKIRLRRSMANEKIDTWASLEECINDLEELKKDSNVPADIRIQSERKITSLTPRLKIKQENETQEVLTKLKDLGNGFLGKFGMSLDNFKFTQNENEGGYSMKFGDNNK
jgi:tetratricopeptide (TPR) repeat protein